MVSVKLSDNYYRFSIEEPKGNLDKDFVLVYKLSQKKTRIDVITYANGKEDGYFLLNVTPGEEEKRLNPGVEYTFILDISGSMREYGKLNIARKGIEKFIKSLSEKDRFELITFNIAPTALFNSLVPATPENCNKAIKFMRRLTGNGGTDIYPALQLALQLQTNDRAGAIVLVSDGRSNEGDVRHKRFIELVKDSPVRIFSFGVGNEVNRPLLSRLAEETGGFADYISTWGDIDVKVELLKNKIVQPVITNLELKFDGVEVYKITPAKLPNLYQGSQLTCYGRYKDAGKVQITLNGIVMGESKIITKVTEFPCLDVRNPEIQRMWALKVIDELLSHIRADSEDESLVKEIVSLDEKYSIVSPYTSFLVLESEEEFKRFGIKRRNLMRI